MLGCVILVATNSRLIIENLLKYGLLYNPVAFLKVGCPRGTLLMGCIAVGSMLNICSRVSDTLSNDCGVQAAVPPANNLPLLFCWPALPLFACLALCIECLGAVRLHFEKKVPFVSLPIWLANQSGGVQLQRK